MNKKIAVVTGGAAGLGFEMVQRLIAQGWMVHVIDIDGERMDALNQRFDSDSYRGYVGDISDENFINATFACIAAMGHIDLLINNAGQPSFKTPVAYRGEDIDKCLKGLKGMVLCCVAALKEDGERDIKIANVMSTAATRGNADESVYCAAKWGEKGYTESLKVAYKGSSVKIVGVYPGGIDTDFYKESHDYVSLEKQHSFMRAGDLAAVIVRNLVCEENLTVSDIRIDRN